MIDILIPVLGRPQNAQPVVDSIRTHTTVPHTITFIVTLGDREQSRACMESGADKLLVHLRKRDQGGRGEYAAKINSAFRETYYPFVLNASDDITFTAGWAENALRLMEEGYDVVATNDRANAAVKRGRFGTHCLIRRSYIDEIGGTFDGEPGVVLYEGYDHNYVDRELCAVAQHYGRYAYAKDSVITHRHPLWKTAEWDDTYRKGHARIREDHALFVERQRAFHHPTTVI